MEDSDIYTRLRDVFREVFDDDSIAVRPNLSAKDVDGWDSLSHVRLMLTVERTFGVKFSASDVGKLKNVEELVRLVQSKSK